jgi:hypothetical protein
MSVHNALEDMIRSWRDHEGDLDVKVPALLLLAEDRRVGPPPPATST